MKRALLVLMGLLAASDHGPARGAEKGCPADKIQFTKETGCRTDDYVQFCAPAADKKVRAAVRRIAPTATARPERHCSDKESLFFLPVSEETGECVERWGAMTDKGWKQVCALARLPQITSIRSVIFE